MTTKAEYEALVLRPGKFESEASYVPYFWDQFLEGMADEDDGERLTFKVSAEDIAMFPNLMGREAVHLIETDSGFVIEVNE